MPTDMSLPSWERGLKSSFAPAYNGITYVAPLAGVRIEISDTSDQDTKSHGRLLHCYGNNKMTL